MSQDTAHEVELHPNLHTSAASKETLAYYAARYNLDLDLITRGSGFGYHGSVVSNSSSRRSPSSSSPSKVRSMAQVLQLGPGIHSGRATQRRR
jgi:hypothetical protein